MYGGWGSYAMSTNNWGTNVYGYTTNDLTYPYGYALVNANDGDAASYVDNIACRAGQQSFLSTKTTAQMSSLYMRSTCSTDGSFLVTPSGAWNLNAGSYPISKSRVFWCANNWKLRALPDPACALSADSKIASCPTTILNQFLCIP